MADLSGFSDVLGRLKEVSDFGAYVKCKCPAHDDDKASLSLSVGETGCLIMKCHAGCSFDEVVRATGLPMGKFFKQDAPSYSKPRRGIKKAYSYNNENGVLQYQVVRFEPKDFRPRRPPNDTDESSTIKGGWVWNMKGVSRVLYRIDEIKQALRDTPDRMVFIVEGEKDADRLWDNGFLATTNAGGAGKWESSYSESLRGCNVVVIPDKDKENPQTGKSAGMAHALIVKSELDTFASRVEIVEMPDISVGQDVSDWFDMGGTQERFRGVVSSVWVVCPDTTPESCTEASGGSIEPAEKTVELTVREMITAGEFGVVRRSNKLMEMKRKKGSGNILGWEYCIENVAGELAVAKFLGMYWQGGFAKGVNIQVRVRREPDANFNVRRQAGACVFVFVTGSCPTFTVQGAIHSNKLWADVDGDAVDVARDILCDTATVVREYMSNG